MKINALLLLATVAPAFAQYDTWLRLMNEGDASEHAGDYALAVVKYQGAVKAAELCTENPAARLVPALNSLGLSYDWQGQYLNAIPVYERALSTLEAAKGRENGDYAVILTNFAAVYSRLQRLAKAESIARESVRLHRAAVARRPLGLSVASSTLAQILVEKGAYKEAEALIEGDVIALGKETGPARRYFGVALNNLAVIRTTQGRHSESLQLLQTAIGELEKALGDRHPSLLETLNNLARAYMNVGDRSHADMSFQRALAIGESDAGRFNPTYNRLIQNYALFLRQTGRKRDADRLVTRSKDAVAQGARVNGIGITVDASSFQRTSATR